MSNSQVVYYMDGDGLEERMRRKAAETAIHLGDKVYKMDLIIPFTVSAPTKKEAQFKIYERLLQFGFDIRDFHVKYNTTRITKRENKKSHPFICKECKVVAKNSKKPCPSCYNQEWYKR